MRWALGPKVLNSASSAISNDGDFQISHAHRVCKCNSRLLKALVSGPNLFLTKQAAILQSACPDVRSAHLDPCSKGNQIYQIGFSSSGTPPNISGPHFVSIWSADNISLELNVKEVPCPSKGKIFHQPCLIQPVPLGFCFVSGPQVPQTKSPRLSVRPRARKQHKRRSIIPLSHEQHSPAARRREPFPSDSNV